MMAGGGVSCHAALPMKECPTVMSSVPVVNITQQAAHKVLRFWGDLGLLRKLEELFPVHNLPTGGHWILRVEWRVPDNHLKHDGSHTPPVTLHPIPAYNTLPDTAKLNLCASLSNP